MIKSVKKSDSIKFPFSFCLWTRNFCWFICRRNQFGLHSLGRMLLWRRQLPVGNLFATTYLLWKCCLRIYYLVHCTYFQLRFMARKSVLSPGFFFQFLSHGHNMIFVACVSSYQCFDLQMWHMHEGFEQIINQDILG